MAPTLVPLEQRKIATDHRNGLNSEVPAINKLWSVTRTWTRYTCPPDTQEMMIPGAVDTWLAVASGVSADLTWLLRLQCHKFWSQV